MALTKEKTIKGYPAEYWKITWIKLNTMDYSFSCELGLYKDKACRDVGRENMVDSKTYTWTDPTAFAEISALTALGCFGWAYDKIVESVLDEGGSETNWFIDAVSVLEE